MRIVFDGREWDFDMEAITVKQAVAMHLAYGFNLDQWLEACGDTDPRALQCLWWLMLQQDGQQVAIKDADCRLVDLAAAFADALGGDEGEPEPDPTPPSSPPSPPGGPPSPAPGSPTGTTPTPPAPPRARRAIASTPGI